MIFNHILAILANKLDLLANNANHLVQVCPFYPNSSENEEN
jgi:hypothetical protein